MKNTACHVIKNSVVTPFLHTFGQKKEIIMGTYFKIERSIAQMCSSVKFPLPIERSISIGIC